MADYFGHLANCAIVGELCSQTETGSHRNLIRLHIDPFDVELVQDPALLSSTYSDLRGHFVPSTDFVIRDLHPDRFDEAERVVRYTCELLSFATCSGVCYFGYDYAGLNAHSARYSVFGTFDYFRPVLDLVNGTMIRTFVEHASRTYCTLRSRRHLNIALHYHLKSHAHEPIELRLVVLFVLLENLKHSYALTSGYPLINGYFRKPGSTAASPGSRVSFRTLLESMFAGAGMQPTLGPLVELRNALIHSGISDLGDREQWALYASGQDCVREYLLRILGYHGAFLSYTSCGYHTIP